MRVLRYQGKDPAKVDPHWDFEHDPKIGWTADALRLWRSRVFLAGPQRASVEVKLDKRDAEGKRTELDPRRHVRRFVGGSDLSAEAYVAITSREVVAMPPMLVLAVDLSLLAPGEYALTTNVRGADQKTKDLRFSVVRRPVYMTHDPRGSAPPQNRPLRVHSCTGLREVPAGTKTRLLTAHRWPVYRCTWSDENADAAGYTSVESLDVVAVTVFDDNCLPQETRWRVMSPETAADPLAKWSEWEFELWNRPGDISDDPSERAVKIEKIKGMGIEWPTLVGLPKQPNAEGRFGHGG